jgi:hypothetical protein
MQKKIMTLLFVSLALTNFVTAQIENPVKWAYGKKKVTADTYEIHLKAIIDDGWHIYAQIQPNNSVSIPTSFVFNSGDDFLLIGKTKEVGKLIKFEDPASGLGANEYSKQIDFVQIIKLKKKSATALTGKLTYQACTDHKCLSAENINFSIPIN